MGAPFFFAPTAARVPRVSPRDSASPPPLQFDTPKFDAPAFEAPKMPAFEAPKMPAMPAMPKAPAPSASSSFGDDEGTVDDQDERDQLARDAAAAFRAADEAAKAQEQIARGLRNDANKAKDDANKAKDVACETHWGGKILCFRSVGSGF